MVAKLALSSILSIGLYKEVAIGGGIIEIKHLRVAFH